MERARKPRKSVAISQGVAVQARDVNVAIDGLDSAAIGGSFSVHLLMNGQRIASRFFFQPSDGADAGGLGGPSQAAHFDFILPIDVVSGGTLSVDIEALDADGSRKAVDPDRMGNPTLSVCLMLHPV
ncbi:hypothetical protein [Breoghania sp. L-A4]|uniref:hypothetical protein n=1 Tax=Breoghania sp. L-A4 TaxID=2304600 RepID=UPI000E360669|nr:hypothetical protein [Breoghania sp. L-A4]AXS40726.1 hypothetical protein D1F64_12495 [Breoghania sp. L-A4]